MEQHIKRGDFTPEEYEIAFGEENHLDSMTFALEDGEKMFFSGVVDRMDSIEDDENKYLKIIDCQDFSWIADAADHLYECNDGIIRKENRKAGISGRNVLFSFG